MYVAMYNIYHIFSHMLNLSKSKNKYSYIAVFCRSCVFIFENNKNNSC